MEGEVEARREGRREEGRKARLALCGKVMMETLLFLFSHLPSWSMW